MLDYSNNPKLLADAFRLVSLADHIDVALTVGEYRFDPYNDQDVNLVDLLKLLSLSEFGERMKRVRDMLNDVLIQPTSEPTPEDELNDAAAVFEKHLSNGYLLDIAVDGHRIGWLRRPAE